MTDDEISQTAKLISDWDKKLKEAIQKIESGKIEKAEAEDMLHSLSQKMTSMVKQFSYNREPVVNQEPRKFISKNQLNESLGPVVYTGKGGSLRQKLIEHAYSLEFLDKHTVVRYLNSFGYQEETSKIIWSILRRYLLEHHWQENELNQVVRPKDLKVNLNQATSFEKQVLINATK